MSRFLVVALAVALALTGCQKSLTEKDFAGKWTGHISMADADIAKIQKEKKLTDAVVAEGKKQMAALEIKLDLKDDKTYTIDQGGGVLEGDWTFKESKITLTPMKVAGQTKEEIIKKMPSAKSNFEPLILTVDKEGKSFAGLTPPAAAGAPSATLTFTKSAATSTPATTDPGKAETTPPAEPAKK